MLLLTGPSEKPVLFRVSQLCNLCPRLVRQRIRPMSMAAMFIDWTQEKSRGCQAWELWQTGTFSLAEWPVDPPAVHSRGQREDVGGAVMGHHIPPLGLRPSFFSTAGIIEYSQPTPLLDLLSAKSHPFTRSSQHLMSCGRVQRAGPMDSMWSISERLLQLQNSQRGGWGLCIDYIKVSLLPYLFLLVGFDH